MSSWETPGASDDWYTPAFIFKALGCRFDLDVSSPPRRTNVPCRQLFYYGGLTRDWHGFVWMNPPFGGRNGLEPWLDKFFDHRNGIALTPDRTSAPWWQEAADRADLVLFLRGKVKFIRPDGTLGKSPSAGTTLFAAGAMAVRQLQRAQHIGWLSTPE